MVYRQLKQYISSTVVLTLYHSFSNFVTLHRIYFESGKLLRNYHEDSSLLASQFCNFIALDKTNVGVNMDIK